MDKGFVFISGATGVTGREFAFQYAALNYSLFLTGRGKDRLAAVKADILKKFPEIQVFTYSCALDDSKERDAMYAYIKENGVTFSRAVNVAGVDDEGPFTDFTIEQIRRMIRVNVESTIEITSELIKLKNADKPLKIITIASLSAYFRMPLMALYSASKRMLYHFFLSLKYELKGTGISVTLVLPGAVPTRPDIKDRIKAQGFSGKISSTPVDKLVKKSIKKAERNRSVYVPGLFNKFLRTMSFIIPAGLISRVAGARWKSALKKKRRH